MDLIVAVTTGTMNFMICAVSDRETPSSSASIGDYGDVQETISVKFHPTRDTELHLQAKTDLFATRRVAASTEAFERDKR